jgi:imidazoleglycerol-phosphate dehydratase
MGTGEHVEERLRARVRFTGGGVVNVVTGVPVLDHLLSLVAEFGGFDLELEVAPTGAEAEVAAAGLALGQALYEPLHRAGAAGHGSAVVPTDEALAHIALVVSDRPRFVTNVDLSDARVGGLGTDLVASFMRALAESASLTLHVRLIDGEDTQHVLETIFKGLGAALAQSCRPRYTEETP